MTKILAKRVFLAAAIAASCATSAFAQQQPFTLNPTSLCAPGAQCGPIVADNILISDFATVTLGAGNTFTEKGFLKITGFELGTATVNPIGFDTNYSLYIPFSGAGHLISGNPSNLPGGTLGVFDSLNYQLLGAPGKVTGSENFNSGVLLASGSSVGGFVGTQPSTSGVKFVATGNVDFSFAPQFNGFFTSPVPFYNLGFSQFGVTSTRITLTDTGFSVSQGGGNLTFNRSAVPEPTTVALLGLGLLGVAASRRKSAKSKNA